MREAEHPPSNGRPPGVRWSRRRRPGCTQNLGNGVSLRGRLTHAPQVNGYGLCCELPPAIESKPPTTANASLHHRAKSACHGYQRNPLTLLMPAKNRTTVEVRFRRRSRLATMVLLGLHRALCPCTAANRQGNISACRPDDLGEANGKSDFKVTDYACPQHGCGVSRCAQASS